MKIIIPNKIKLIYSDIATSYLTYGFRTRGVSVYPVYADGPQSIIDKAINWAKSQGVMTPSGVNFGPKQSIVFIDEVNNDPIKNIKVISTVYRNNHTVYKIITENSCIFDLQERVFVEAMLNKGVKKGGILGGEFIWTREGQHMRLVLVGSSLHSAAIKYQDKKEK